MYKYTLRFKCILKSYESNDDSEYNVGEWVIVNNGRHSTHIGIIVEKHNKNKNNPEYVFKYEQTKEKSLVDYISRKATTDEIQCISNLRNKEEELKERLNCIDTEYFQFLDVEFQLDDKKIIIYFEPSYTSIKESNCDYELFQDFLKKKLELAKDLMFSYRKRVWLQQINYPDTELVLPTNKIESCIKQKEPWNLVKSNLAKIGSKVY